MNNIDNPSNNNITLDPGSNTSTTDPVLVVTATHSTSGLSVTSRATYQVFKGS